MKTEYKTSRKYKCPYCELKATRSELIDHVDERTDDPLHEKRDGCDGADEQADEREDRESPM